MVPLPVINIVRSSFKMLNQRTLKNEFPCRPRFSFGMSSTGKELYIYGAGFQVEVYDAATLQLKQVTDLGNDVTMAGFVVIP